MPVIRAFKNDPTRPVLLRTFGGRTFSESMGGWFREVTDKEKDLFGNSAYDLVDYNPRLGHVDFQKVNTIAGPGVLSGFSPRNPIYDKLSFPFLVTVGKLSFPCNILGIGIGGERVVWSLNTEVKITFYKTKEGEITTEQYTPTSEEFACVRVIVDSSSGKIVKLLD